MSIDFLGMQAFLGIVEHGSFQQAARSLNLSQTAVSHRMRKFEESLGVRLITRTTREITLTDAGRALLPSVRAALRALEASVSQLRGAHGASRQWLGLACLPTVATWQLHGPLRQFAQQWPHIRVRVLDCGIREIVELVQSEAAAFGISVDGASTSGLQAQAVAVEPFVAVCHPSHSLAARSDIHWHELGQTALIRISLPAGNRATIDEVLDGHQIFPNWALEVQRTALALNWVHAGLGLTVVPRLAVAQGDGLHVLKLLGPQITRRLVVLTRHGGMPDAPARALCDLVTAQIRSALADA